MTKDEFIERYHCPNCSADPLFVYRHEIREYSIPQYIALQNDGSVDFYPIRSRMEETDVLGYYFHCNKCNHEWDRSRARKRKRVS